MLSCRFLEIDNLYITLINIDRGVFGEWYIQFLLSNENISSSNIPLNDKNNNIGIEALLGVNKIRCKPGLWAWQKKIGTRGHSTYIKCVWWSYSDQYIHMNISFYHMNSCSKAKNSPKYDIGELYQMWWFLESMMRMRIILIPWEFFFNLML